MSNRLESLNPKKPGPKPGLKFKPKTVARKSKEDRDREAPDIKQEDRPRSQAAARGRGGARGRGRGRGGAYVGTHVVSAGPLAMGSVGVGGGLTNSKTGLTSDKIFSSGESQNVAPLAGLKLKAREGSQSDDSDSDDDPTKINMNKDYAFDDTETVLFPVRPQKQAAALSEPELISQSVSPSSRAQTAESVKSEDIEMSPAVASGPILVNPDEKQEADEHDRIIDDQRSIVDMLTRDFDGMKTDDSAGHDQYVLVHVPQITPADVSADASGESKDASTKTPKYGQHGSLYASPNTHAFDGQIGTLNFHQSGKISMTVGKSQFSCAGGTPASFLQELYIIENSEVAADDEDTTVRDADGHKIAGRIYRLGEVTGKIVATPAI